MRDKKIHFTGLTTTQLGTLAEQLYIEEFADSINYGYYNAPSHRSHSIDSILMSGASIILLDIKCKSSRKFYPDTGFDLADYESYIEKNKKFPVYILFVDITKKKIYGNFLQRLTPTYEGNIVYFPLSEMKLFRKMSEDEYKQLKSLERSNYN